MRDSDLNAEHIHEERRAAVQGSNRDGSIRVIDDAAFSQIRSLASTMVANPEIQADRRCAIPGNSHSGSENPGSRPVRTKIRPPMMSLLTAAFSCQGQFSPNGR